MMDRRPATLKKQARELLAGRWGLPNVAALFRLVSEILTAFVISRFFPTALRSTMPFVLAVSVGLILILFLYVIRAGLTRVILRIARQQKAVPADIVYAFKDQPDRFLTVGVLYTVMQMLYVVPLVCYISLVGLTTLPGIVLTAVWGIGGGLYLLRFHLTYVMAVPALIDDPMLGAMNAMKKSAALMKGQRLHLLHLEFTFIGWGLIALLSTGIGLLWIVPYHEAARLLYYLDLVRERQG